MPSAPDRDADRHRLRLFLSGDEGTARALTAIARETVARRAFGLDPAERDDLVQESIAQLWAACTRDGFDLDSTLDGFARTITTARCIDHFRRRRWQQELHESIPLEAEHPLDEIHRERTLEAVRKAVASLRPLCRDLIQWHFHEGQRYDQIAARTGRAASTLRVHMHRCLRQLRTTLKVEGEVS